MSRGNDQQRVAICGCPRSDFRTDDCIGAAAVINDDLLPQVPWQARRDNASDHIHRATGRERYYQAYRSAG